MRVHSYIFKGDHNLYFRTVIRLDGSVPVKYGLRLNMDEKYSSVKTALSGLCGVSAHLLRLAEVTAAQIKVCILKFQVVMF